VTIDTWPFHCAGNTAQQAASTRAQLALDLQQPVPTQRLLYSSTRPVNKAYNTMQLTFQAGTPTMLPLPNALRLALWQLARRASQQQPPLPGSPDPSPVGALTRLAGSRPPHGTETITQDARRPITRARLAAPPRHPMVPASGGISEGATP
jgi:hypothetical protein